MLPTSFSQYFGGVDQVRNSLSAVIRDWRIEHALSAEAMSEALGLDNSEEYMAFETGTKPWPSVLLQSALAQLGISLDLVLPLIVPLSNEDRSLLRAMMDSSNTGPMAASAGDTEVMDGSKSVEMFARLMFLNELCGVSLKNINGIIAA